MKVFDIVFSPTGGTEKASGYIANTLEGETVAVDLTDSGLGFRTVAMTKEDVAVIAVPSYGGRVPAVAAERLGMMRFWFVLTETARMRTRWSSLKTRQRARAFG